MQAKNDVWIFIQEAEAIFCKPRGSVDFAIWKDKVRARQSLVGATWMLEYNSCVEHWGKPKNLALAEQVIGSFQDA